MSIIFHIDVNSAYLSWAAAEAIKNGSELDYRKIVSIVGGDQSKRHGVVLARSEPAKALGIKTGESISNARSKCRDIYMIPPDHDLYIESSNKLLQLLGEYTENIERYSIDEAFCDMSQYNDNYLEVAQLMSERIKKELGFTVNIGIGDNKLLAKMASDFKKPDKIHTLFKDEIEEKLWPLDVGKLFMVGRRTKDRLNSRGVKTIGDLAKLDRHYLYQWLKKHGLTIHDYANGISDDQVISEKRDPKSIGHSTTTSYDIQKFDDGKRYLYTLSNMVAMRLKRYGKLAGVVSVSIKNHDFRVVSRQITLQNYTNNSKIIYRTSIKLLSQIWDEEGIRMFSVSTSDLISNDKVQISMFESFINGSHNKVDKNDSQIQSKIKDKNNKRMTFSRMNKLLKEESKETEESNLNMKVTWE